MISGEIERLCNLHRGVVCFKNYELRMADLMWFKQWSFSKRDFPLKSFVAWYHAALGSPNPRWFSFGANRKCRTKDQTRPWSEDKNRSLFTLTDAHKRLKYKRKTETSMIRVTQTGGSPIRRLCILSSKINMTYGQHTYPLFGTYHTL